MTWSPLKNGRLSGKYRRDEQHPDDARRPNASGIPNAEWPIIDELCAVADELGASPAATAIAWVKQRAGVTSTLIGARTVEQLQSNLGALDITFAPQQLDRLDAASAPTLGFPAMYVGYTGTAQFAGATVDGHAHDVNPPLLTSTTRYRAAARSRPTHRGTVTGQHRSRFDARLFTSSAAAAATS